MSELTPCNYCSLKSIERRAKASGQKVSVLHDAHWGMGGVNVYVHPKIVRIEALPGGEDGPRSKYRVSWMKEIGSGCGC